MIESPLSGDISEEQASKLLLEEAVKRSSRVDVLVNNAEMLDKHKRETEIYLITIPCILFYSGAI
jgi:NAD(P)-dependent dehydrogenase (short-subunit alcohol dehydrogenase family)